MTALLIGALELAQQTIATLDRGIQRRLRRFLRSQAFLMVAGLTLLFVGGSAQAGFLDDNADFGAAIAGLRTAIGDHPRVLIQ